jgi:O-acetylhomoserine (thiol)-lyase
LVIHGGWRPDPATGSPLPPVAQTGSFAYESADELESVFAGRAPGYVYSRIANPTVSALESRITALEGGAGALAAASGMNVISTLAITLCGAGGQIVSSRAIFGGTYSLFARTLAHLGMETVFVDARDPAAVAAAIGERCRMVFVETISNPAMEVPDLSALATVARTAGVPLVVDSTVTTPYLIRPGELGAALAVHSTSKFINGHGTAIGGILVDCGNFDWGAGRHPHLEEFTRRAGQQGLLAALRQRYWRDLGGCQAPLNAFLQGAGLDTLAVRMERHCANAAALALFLNGHPAVRRVYYPGLPDSPYHDAAARQFGGKFGSILSFELAGPEQCFRLINALRLALNLANLGEARTLVIHPASTICRDFSEAEKEAIGANPRLVRVCTGLEHPDDILEDFAQALRRI